MSGVTLLVACSGSGEVNLTFFSSGNGVAASVIGYSQTQENDAGAASFAPITAAGGATATSLDVSDGTLRRQYGTLLVTDTAGVKRHIIYRMSGHAEHECMLEAAITPAQ